MRVAGSPGAAWRVARLALRAGGLVAAALFLWSCATLEPDSGSGGPRTLPGQATPPPDAALPGTPAARQAPDAPGGLRADARIEDEILRGSGEFFDAERAARAVRAEEPTGDVSLNFEAADLREVVSFVLGELLELNYLIEDGVQGQVTLQTTRPLSRDALLPTLEQILRLRGVVIVPVDGVHQVMPRDRALQGTVAPGLRAGDPGFGVRIVPLEYIGAAEMYKILEPFLTPGSAVRVDRNRNLLILAGTRRELAQWLETVEIFDVDWLKGMSVGLFTLKNAEVDAVADALQRVLADPESPVFGLFRLIPVQRLNALLVITPQPRYLDEAKEWITRLDRSRDVHTPRLHVYRMQNGKAADVAEVLTQVYTGSGVPRAEPEASLAPGMTAVELGGTQEASAERAGGRSVAEATVIDAGTVSGTLDGEVRIIADDRNNALLVLASARDYEVIEAAVRELDIPPMQVLVDATIVEVTLSDELRYGLQWFFKDNLGSGYRGRGIFGSSDSATLAQTFPGFNYSIVDSASQVRAVLSALAEDSLVNVLSSPSVMVLDNQTAVIRVGDQVPVRTTETASVVTDSPVIVSNIQFRDTGVSLEVTPRVNAGGMVLMDVKQEVNDVARTTTSGIDSPTIQQRLIESSVAVQSGETVVLGGLIRDSNSRTETGVPGLHRMPLFGPLFGTTRTSMQRTELLVLITPQVARDVTETRVVTEEFRRRMEGLGDWASQPAQAPVEPAAGVNAE
ncbi:General secretion pathway protein D [Thioalkalivibrio nitratireducens DSM 14787]|uniref:General secretion pathway protein D n=1 Tax=Thioalkalivibrio nitratireducens (strain DSM 14787 / UNIQEM 213 / ALEN2) TaxID=1255043 RepID=L0DX82_THIND|nr:General secretion pathway protein D [Thioalkalivibrio nitratireducens DSM 14787]